jgi:hypothetical protein
VNSPPFSVPGQTNVTPGYLHADARGTVEVISIKAHGNVFYYAFFFHGLVTLGSAVFALPARFAFLKAIESVAGPFHGPIVSAPTTF